MTLTNNWINKTQRDYNIIAKNFDQKRQFFWNELKLSLNYIKSGDRVLDLGCGNGRLFKEIKNTNKNINYWGIDFSQELLNIAKKSYSKANFKFGDIAKKTTFKQLSNFDIAFCLAVLHHFPTRSLQEKVLVNIKNTLKPNGLLILSVWNLWQKKYWNLHLNGLGWKIKTGFKLRWLKVPYKISDGRKVIKTVHRYCYCFTLNELEDLVESNGFRILEKKVNKNLCLIAQKAV